MNRNCFIFLIFIFSLSLYASNTIKIVKSENDDQSNEQHNTNKQIKECACYTPHGSGCACKPCENHTTYHKNESGMKSEESCYFCCSKCSCAECKIVSSCFPVPCGKNCQPIITKIKELFTAKAWSKLARKLNKNPKALNLSLDLGGMFSSDILFTLINKIILKSQAETNLNLNQIEEYQGLDLILTNLSPEDLRIYDMQYRQSLLGTILSYPNLLPLLVQFSAQLGLFDGEIRSSCTLNEFQLNSLQDYFQSIDFTVDSKIISAVQILFEKVPMRWIYFFQKITKTRATELAYDIFMDYWKNELPEYNLNKNDLKLFEDEYKQFTSKQKKKKKSKKNKEQDKKQNKPKKDKDKQKSKKIQKDKK